MESLPTAINHLVFEQLDAPSLACLQCALGSHAKAPETDALFRTLMQQRMIDVVDKTLRHATHVILDLVDNWICHRSVLETMMVVTIGNAVLRCTVSLPNGFAILIDGNALPEKDRPALVTGVLQMLRGEIAADTLPYMGNMAHLIEAFCGRWRNMVDGSLVEYRFLALPGDMGVTPLVLYSNMEWNMPRNARCVPLLHRTIQAEMAAAEQAAFALTELCHTLPF